MKKYFSLLLFLFAQIVIPAQTATISLPDTTVAIASDTLFIPVKVTNFNNVGAISIKIQYDSTILTFKGITNKAASITSNKIRNEIALGWFSTDGVTSLSITNGKLLDLKFTYTTGISNLNFNSDNGQCEISTLNGTIIPATFQSGRVDVSNVTPVELTSFTGLFMNSEVHLNWSTATETNNKGFEIERLYKNETWNKVGFVTGSGSTVEKHTYSYSDKPGQTGNYQYRLKQIDFNGSYEYSDIVNVEINLTPGKYALLQNYPNPFNPSTIISYSIPSESYVSLAIYDAIGNQVETLVNEKQAPGRYEVNFSADRYSSGVYFYKLQAGNFTATKKLLLAK